MNVSSCVVLLTNSSFFDKMIYTLHGLINSGYKDNICVVIGDDLKESEKLKHPLLSQNNITIKHFPDIIFSNEFISRFNTIERASHWRQKIFQYHKFHLFNIYFKQWKYIFYIDSGSTIFSSIQPLLNAAKQNTFLAHSDAYPQYTWKLNGQFVNVGDEYIQLTKEYNLDIDYPQTTIMLYDTSIITESTFKDLVELAERYNFSMSNDQGIVALYFTNIKPLWEQIKLGDENMWYYDYLLRPEKCNKRHIILKSL